MTSTTRSPIPPGTLDMLILKTVAAGRELHGFQIAEAIERESREVLQVEEGSLYPALQRLLKAKLVSAEWGVSSTNRRVRIYQLTRAGTKHLATEVSRFEQMLNGVSRVLALGGGAE